MITLTEEIPTFNVQFLFSLCLNKMLLIGGEKVSVTTKAIVVVLASLFRSLGVGVSPRLVFRTRKDGDPPRVSAAHCQEAN